MHFKSLPALLDYFIDEATCRNHLERMRWADGFITCPHCENDQTIYRTKRGYKCGNSKCYKKFSVISGTVFESTKLPLRTWFAGVWLATAHKKGISSTQLSRDLGIPQKTAWFVLHRIRELMKEKSPAMLKGIVEIDETYVGGDLKNKHKSIRQANKHGNVGRITGYTHMTPVFGLIERQGNVIAQVVPANDGVTLQPIIRDLVQFNSFVVTDGMGAYYGLSDMYKHQVINHSQDEFKRGRYHTNTIEGFFSLFKRGIIGIYHYASPKHLQRYCDEFTGRYNTRDMSDSDRFNWFLGKCKCRLSYNQLVFGVK